jgi:GH3 auxin-responsive promoter
MSLVPFCLNTLWMWSSRREWRAFHRAARNSRATQFDVLRETIRRNADAEFGRRYGFASIASADEFRRRVPLVTYESIAADIGRIAEGETRVLTAEPVRLLEPTSGSTSGRKLIPCTDSLRREFQRMVAAWIYDLLRHRPAVRRGRAYWSISPAIGAIERTAGNIPIGFDNDTAYLGGLERLLMRRLLAVRPEVARLTDIEEFRYETLFYLLSADDLSLISIWSPTFLITLLQQLETWTERICTEFANRDGRRWARPGRGKHVARILESSQPLPGKLRELWPNLTLVSCWADAAAGTFLPELQRLLPHVEIQPKGLLSTEGCVSFPLVGHAGAALALRSHFFEFADPNADGETAPTSLADELQIGGEYAVVITTGGGLYRYRTGDLVKVVGFADHCPLLTFLGRSGCTSDVVGEKLSEPFVRCALNEVFREAGITRRFAMLVPVIGDCSRYRLYVQIDGDREQPPECIEALATRLQRHLEKNIHYRLAVQLGQLLPVDVRLLHESGWRIFERRNLAEGRRAGDIKPAALDSRPGWEAAFAPAVQGSTGDAAGPSSPTVDVAQTG